MTATRNPGAFITQYVDSTYLGGIVAVGARADLVMLSGNPLADLTIARRPVGVLLGGRWFDQAALEAMRRRVMAANRRERAGSRSK